jgi:poly(3-hydroxybutyrate) depolymerase
MWNAGHVWPGGEHVLPRLTGPMNRDFDASNVIWLFFDNVWR